MDTLTNLELISIISNLVFLIGFGCFNTSRIQGE